MSSLMDRAAAVREYASQCRRHLHQHPELSFEEKETTAFIRSELERMGIELLPLEIPYGAVGIVRGTRPGNAVTALRADIDALPITEATGRPHASQNQGIMHACGHDGHAATLLGTARLLQEMRDSFGGTVKLIFQPAEERLGGAKKMVEEGVVDDVEEVVCLHGSPDHPVGTVGFWAGQYMASADSFAVTVNGRGGHGARPHETINPIPAAAMAIVALQNIVSSEISSAHQAVATVGSIQAGTAFNIIPESAFFQGTVRCLDEDVREEMETRIRRTIEGAVTAFGCSCNIHYNRGVASVYNHPEVVAALIGAATQELGESNVGQLNGAVMGSEDFCYFINKVGRGALFRLGLAADAPHTYATLHTPYFDFNDDAIPTGIAVFLRYVLNRHQ